MIWVLTHKLGRFSVRQIADTLVRLEVPFDVFKVACGKRRGRLKLLYDNRKHRIKKRIYRYDQQA